MSPGKVKATTVVTKADHVQSMLDGIARLPLGSLDEFASDPIVAAAAESYLRRALEALLDLGRHILAKGLGHALAEYKEVAVARAGILDRGNGELLVRLAGYRNRMVHFYDEISTKELYQICSEQAGDVGRVLGALLAWVRAHPERVDGTI